MQNCIYYCDGGRGANVTISILVGNDLARLGPAGGDMDTISPRKQTVTESKGHDGRCTESTKTNSINRKALFLGDLVVLNAVRAAP